ncbi:hypothetical protein BpHYR1_005938 [Brachionus plicatilis]|uniref:Uncharacterized protein n=1 Tax=Brachionus plicatilis TaxID=10195 RepID=A0A3M7SQZ7_BRAPC|nr:hypothetical protein BpHYR1_005938 [Brachionus plicatilis]
MYTFLVVRLKKEVLGRNLSHTYSYYFKYHYLDTLKKKKNTNYPRQNIVSNLSSAKTFYKNILKLVHYDLTQLIALLPTSGTWITAWVHSFTNT